MIRFCHLILLSLLVLPIYPAQAEKGENEASFPLLGRSTRLDISLHRLTTGPGVPEKFTAIEAPEKEGLEYRCVQSGLAANSAGFEYHVTNRTEKAQLVKVIASAVVPFEESTWWNGYANQVSERFEGDRLLSMWFPVNAAIGKESAFLLGLHPGSVYSRVESYFDQAARRLVIEIPLVVDAGATVTASFVLSALPVRYGYRDIVQHYYDLFPKNFQPQADISPSVISTQSTYLFWKPATYDVTVPGDLIRRFSGGEGGWEWCYAPFIRGGDWATSYEFTKGFRNRTEEMIDAHKEQTAGRFRAAEDLNVAPMYYVNVLWAEKTLMDEHFPEALSNPVSRKSWGNEAYVGLYPWANRYGELFSRSLQAIAKDFPMTRGIGWDSAFGHFEIDDSVAGVLQTVEKSHRDGKIFALSGVGFTHLFDLNHSLKSEGFSRANAVNLKLVSPYFLSVRTDAALYEGSPVEDPKRLGRFESMRARLGSPKVISWHKHLLPGRLKWVRWQDLSPQEVEEAYRQLHDDALILSYYWGAIPSPGMPALGVERTFLAIPELIELARLGWQPSPGVDHGEGVLVARYGKGAGSAVVVMNPGFEKIDAELFFPKEYWNEEALFLVRKDGKELRCTMDQQGTQAIIELAPRSIVTLTVLGVGTPNGPVHQPVRLVSSGSSGALKAGKPSHWNFKVESIDNFHWDCRFPLGDAYALADVEGENFSGKYARGVLEMAVDSSSWEDDVQNMNLRRNEFTLTAKPAITAGFDSADLRKPEWFPTAGKTAKGVALVVDASAGKEASREAERLRDWFAFYSENVLEGSFLPGIAQKAPEGQPAIILRLLPELQASGQRGQMTMEGNQVILSASNRTGLKQTALAFLELMDVAFPYYGTLPEKSKDQHLERAGLLGKVLTPDAKSDFVLKPTLVERLRDASLR